MPIYRLELDPAYPTLNPVNDEEWDSLTYVDPYTPKNWKPVEVELAIDNLGPKRLAGDLLQDIPAPIFSAKAYTVLKDLLEGKGIAFPLISKDGDFIMFRVENKPNIDLDEPSLDEESIFCLELTDPEAEVSGDVVFVSHVFRERVEKEALKGFLFADPHSPRFDFGGVRAQEQLTEEMLLNASESDLWSLVYDHALAAVIDQNGEIDLSRLPSGERTLFLIQDTIHEVLNGGFHQYFWNTNGERVSVTLAALKAIGAVKHARIFQGAAELFKKENPSFAGYQLLGTLDAFSSSSVNNDFDELTKKFIEMPSAEENVWYLACTYIRTHTKDFVTPLK